MAAEAVEVEEEPLHLARAVEEVAVHLQVYRASCLLVAAHCRDMLEAKETSSM